MVTAGKFLPPRVSEESARKLPKASAYRVSSVGVEVGVRYCHCSITIDVHPPTLPQRKVLTFSQFREASSAGGAGRKFQEGSEGKHSRKMLH